MALKIYAKFEEKLSPGSKNDTKNLMNLNASSSKPENLRYDVLLLSIVYKVSAKKVRRIITHNTKERSTIWRKTDVLLEKWHEEFDELYPSSGKCENFHFDGLSL